MPRQPPHADVVTFFKFRRISSIRLSIPLGQFTRNYTQTTKRGLLTTNKG